jgi:hypothetical protein
MSKADTEHTPSRRRLLTGSAATLLAGAAAITAARAAMPEATSDDAELIRLCHAFIAAGAAVNAFSGGDIPDELWVNYYHGPPFAGPLTGSRATLCLCL